MKEDVFKNIGASNPAREQRQADDYLLLEVEPRLNKCACGEGHQAKVFDEVGKLSKASDLINRGYGTAENFSLNNKPYHNGDIITNPPYKYAQEFVEHALSLVDIGRYVCMFLKVLFLESQSRKELFIQYSPKIIYFKQ